MKKILCICVWLHLFAGCLIPTTVCGAERQVVAVGQFSAMTAGGRVLGWQPMTFKKIKSHTRYALVSDQGRTVLRADSLAAASGLIRKVNLNPGDYPYLTWSWKVSNTMEKGDVRKKSGDDYAARIYITFAENPDDLSFLERTKIAAFKLLYGEAPPSAALAYIWGNRAAAGSIHPNPYTDRVQMIVIESGQAHVNQWRRETRNIVEDFRLVFGTEPPPLSGIAVMTDTDNTDESATAWYGDIALMGPH